MALRNRFENEIIYGRPHVAPGISFLCKQSLRFDIPNNKINQCKYTKKWISQYLKYLKKK